MKYINDTCAFCVDGICACECKAHDCGSCKHGCYISPGMLLCGLNDKPVAGHDQGCDNWEFRYGRPCSSDESKPKMVNARDFIDNLAHTFGIPMSDSKEIPKPPRPEGEVAEQIFKDVLALQRELCRGGDKIFMISPLQVCFLAQNEYGIDVWDEWRKNTKGK